MKFSWGVKMGNKIILSIGKQSRADKFYAMMCQLVACLFQYEPDAGNDQTKQKKLL